MKSWLIKVGSIIGLVVFDQVSKYLVKVNMETGEIIHIIPNIFKLNYQRNYKGFSWFMPELPEWSKDLFIIVRIIILVLLVLFYNHYRKKYNLSMFSELAFILLGGGIAGNLMEDFYLPYTTDFLQILNSPCANLADLYSYTGVFFLVMEIVRIKILKN